jgi:hypothetical protein
LIQPNRFTKTDLVDGFYDTEKMINPLSETICPLREQTKDAFCETEEVKNE